MAETGDLVLTTVMTSFMIIPKGYTTFHLHMLEKINTWCTCSSRSWPELLRSRLCWFFSTNSRLDKSSIPGFWDILSFEKERLPRGLAGSDMNILPKLIWKILNKIFVVILLESKPLFWGEKKHILTKFSAGYLRCHSFGNLQNRPMDAFHHFLMEFPALPWCALPFSYFFIPFSLS